MQALDAGPDGLRFAEQDEAQVTYAEKIDREDRQLDPARPAPGARPGGPCAQPHIGAGVTLAGGERLGVWEAVARPRGDGDPPAGELSLDGALPLLGCAPGTLELTVVQPAGRRAMAADAYLRGLRG